jgi:signal transduction histidine kinase
MTQREDATPPPHGPPLDPLASFGGKSTEDVHPTGQADDETAQQRCDELLWVAGHELRTPLSTLRLHAEALIRAVQSGNPSDPAQLSARATKVVHQCERLDRLLSSLLDAIRASDGQLALHRETLDLSAVARDIVDQLADAAQDEQTQLTLDAAQPVLGQWDRLRLELVLTNLISNAQKHARGAPVSVRVWQQPGRALVSVTDQGDGIALEDQERIFERFQRTASGRRRDGLGLGLWIARRLVTELGGALRLSSVPGNGATFTVEFPLT